jgi:putative membrane protein
MRDKLSDADLQRIREAVTEAEARTSGEIVPYFVAQSDSYEVAIWKGVGAAVAVALLIAVLIFNFYSGWGLGWLHTGWGMALFILLAGTAGGLIGVFVPPARRALIGPRTLTRTVHRNAMKAFVDEEVFNTRDRTGILLFISTFEHRIEVLGDVGINEKVSSDEWADIVEHIRDGIKQGRFVDGVIDGIGMCGHLLEKSGVEIRGDDKNELPDAVRFRKND